MYAKYAYASDYTPSHTPINWCLVMKSPTPGHTWTIARTEVDGSKVTRFLNQTHVFDLYVV